MTGERKWEWFIRECPVCGSKRIVDDIGSMETSSGVFLYFGERCLDCGTVVKTEDYVSNDDLEG